MYKSLTDDAIRQNYEQYGHPDGKQEFSMGIALPKWIVETRNSGYVLAVYGLLFGICLPWFVGNWWYGSRRYTKDGVLTSSAELFFRELKEETTFAQLVEILSASVEFSEDAPGGPILRQRKEFDKLERIVKEYMKAHTEDRLEGQLFKKPSAKRAAVLIYAHLLRVPIDDLNLLKGERVLRQG